MKRLLLCAAVFSLAATAASAALPTGAVAPDFKTTAALGGKDHPFDLAATRKKGPVVLYFFPAAFTSGCTAEAHEFAEATEDFNKLGATVIGMTGAARVDGKMQSGAEAIEGIKRFSSEECRDKFAVALASPETVKNYDVASATNPAMTTRTSYVIAPNGKVLMSYTDGNFAQHVTNAMAAVKAYKKP
jgi:thioredoxin-dependent peroxiredoxin